MIRRLSGTVLDTSLTHVVLDVNGVGYLVHTTKPGLDFPINEPATFWTHLAVRETALDIYGFTSTSELEIFELLLTLPKIGPKSAAQILGQADIDLLKEAVLQGDASYLAKMSGIGKKSAEKIVMGLKDKFEQLGYDAQMLTGAEGGRSPLVSEAIDALVSLGYPQKDARDAVSNLPKSVTTTSDAVKYALSELNQS